MKSFALACKAFSNFAVALLLSACAGSSIPAGVASGGDVAPQAYKNTKRFHYRGKEQSFVVPSGVTKLTVVAYGARGGGTFQSNYSQLPGYGGRVSAVVPVKSGETLYVYVGGASVGIQGGFNGGGNANGAWGGGGASDIREGGDALRNRILVAGGGGGGYYGGGGGGGGTGTKYGVVPGNGGGGGGGSSYVEPTIKHYSSKQNVRTRDGLVIVSWQSKRPRISAGPFIMILRGALLRQAQERSSG